MIDLKGFLNNFWIVREKMVTLEGIFADVTGFLLIPFKHGILLQVS